ncbi:MAG: hypothetical protein LBJ60_08695 [Tannerellaceae bacterium]|jgi:hypothetical protein|nr:hypothetical protein [Tannerellaceae bacterium]
MNHWITGFDKDKVTTILSWTVYLFVNLIFCIKYNPFGGSAVWYILVAYPALVWGAFRLTRYKNMRQSKYFFMLVAAFILALAFLLMRFIDKYTVDVDRWSALAFWSENLKNGLFPYGTPTHRGGYASPYPVWQLFHFPFHLLGDTGYGQLFCLFVFFLFLYVNSARLNGGGFILLLALSPGFWWEASVRSDLLCNMLLLYLFVSSLFYCRLQARHSYAVAIAAGLFLCTKMLVAIPLFLFLFPYFLRLPGRKKFCFALLVAAGATVPFLPFLFGEQGLLNHPEYNPILQQTRQGNTGVAALLSALIVWASFKWKSRRDYFFLSGLFLFLLIASVGIEITWRANLAYTLFGDEFDVSYLNVSIPFFLFCINEKKACREAENQVLI